MKTYRVTLVTAAKKPKAVASYLVAGTWRKASERAFVDVSHGYGKHKAGELAAQIQEVANDVVRGRSLD